MIRCDHDFITRHHVGEKKIIRRRAAAESTRAVIFFFFVRPETEAAGPYCFLNKRLLLFISLREKTSRYLCKKADFGGDGGGGGPNYNKSYKKKKNATPLCSVSHRR